jgi:hypothetical protein
MIYFWPGENGHFAWAVDPEDEEKARLADILENWEPGSNLGIMMDHSQVVARHAGLMQNAWDRGVRTPPIEDGLGYLFPSGPFSVAVPETADIDKEAMKRRENWRPFTPPEEIRRRHRRIDRRT